MRSIFDDINLVDLSRCIAAILKNEPLTIRENGKAIPKEKALHEMQARLLVATLRPHCKRCGNSGPPSLAKAKRMVRKFNFTALKDHIGVTVSLKGRSLK